MKLKAVLIMFAAFGIACAQTAPETPVNAKDNDKAESTYPTKISDPRENECRICDFDFESYKGELKQEEVEGLLLALNDEYLATATYRGVNEKFDDPRPFVNIVSAEERHASRLKELFETYNIPVPKNPWIGKAPTFESVKEACEAGIDAEVVNKQLYDKLSKSTERDDILFVYKNLQRASEENHKPAFESCASGGNGKGRGRGVRN